MAKKIKLHEPERGEDGLVVGYKEKGQRMFRCINCKLKFPTLPNSHDFGNGCVE